MRPTWRLQIASSHLRRRPASPSRTSSSTQQQQLLLQQARTAALQRREIYLEIREHLPALFPTHPAPSINIRTQQSRGETKNFTSVILYQHPAYRTTTISASRPVVGYEDQYFDDRLVTQEELEQGGWVVLLGGDPGEDQTEAMERLLARVEVLVRSGWASK
ncbi:hypothetical protein GQ43DRAFT_479202 [Delitschia confertaspora ATCC 74209]|uniref:Uncharacterized protein n=1 Tax=Delitschia confertaspora ATCC 74209 TaxID=1513339 RepID=A0A9P4JQ07_9PLEO|nr:hypothetical protein GQ43DRAFT_479202 [Delitschia confertaspora ATCC 74209]